MKVFIVPYNLNFLMSLTFFYVNCDSYFPNTMTLNYLEKRMYRWVVRYMVPLCLSHCYLSTSEFQYLFKHDNYYDFNNNA